MKIDILPPFNRVRPLIDLPIRLSIVSENEEEEASLKELRAKLEEYTIRCGVENSGEVYLEIPLRPIEQVMLEIGNETQPPKRRLQGAEESPQIDGRH